MFEQQSLGYTSAYFGKKNRPLGNSMLLLAAYSMLLLAAYSKSLWSKMMSPTVSYRVVTKRVVVLFSIVLSKLYLSLRMFSPGKPLIGAPYWRMAGFLELALDG